MTKEEFLKSRDFLKLGQSIEHMNWQVATLTINRMQQNAKVCEMCDFDRQFIMLKQCVLGHKKVEAQNVLAAIVAKRVKFLESI